MDADLLRAPNAACFVHRLLPDLTWFLGDIQYSVRSQNIAPCSYLDETVYKLYSVALQ